MCDLVSVIMPSYNTGAYIAEAVRSVQGQTYENWELIIVDDASTDSTDSIVFQFLADSRISYIKNSKNRGAAACRNRALKEAKGRWIAFLDSDDIWEKTKLERQIAYMENNDYHFTYTKYREIDETSAWNGVKVSGPQHISKRGMYRYCWCGCLTVMYDREFVGNIQIKSIKKNNDYAIWLKVIEKADCFLLDECLARYRRRRHSISSAGYGELLKWHYRLFRFAQGMDVWRSIYYTAGNVFWGLYKKLAYTIHIRQPDI